MSDRISFDQLVEKYATTADKYADASEKYAALVDRHMASRDALRATLDGLLALRATCATETPPSPPAARSRPLSYTRGMEVRVDPWEAP